MDLDPINFSDEVFASYSSIRPHGAGEGAGQGRQRKVKEAEMNTDDQLFADQETNTKFKRNAVSVSS